MSSYQLFSEAFRLQATPTEPSPVPFEVETLPERTTLSARVSGHSIVWPNSISEISRVGSEASMTSSTSSS